MGPGIDGLYIFRAIKDKKDFLTTSDRAICSRWPSGANELAVFDELPEIEKYA